MATINGCAGLLAVAGQASVQKTEKPQPEKASASGILERLSPDWEASREREREKEANLILREEAQPALWREV